MQVGPIKPILKAPTTKRFKLRNYGLLSNFAFKFNLRRYNEGWTLVLCGHSLGAGIATALSLHLRQVFPSVRVWGRGLHSFTFQLNLSRF